MQRFLIPTLAAAVVASAASFAPIQASAQNRTYNQNGGTATGNPWMNQNDFDYNQQHWTPPNNNGREGYHNRNQNAYGRNNDRRNNQGYNGREGSGQYQNNCGQYENGYGRDQGSYGQNESRYGGSTYENRNGYNNDRRFNNRPGYGRSDGAPNYNNDD